MEEITTLNLQIDTVTKERAEKVLSQLGLPISTAVNLFLNQVSMTGGIPFELRIPAAPSSVNADLMTKQEFLQEIEEGLEDMEAGEYQGLSKFYSGFLESRGL